MLAMCALGLSVAALAAGCVQEPEPLPPACSAGPEQVLEALRTARGEVRLTGGTLLSECVERASTDADLQIVGFALTPAADRLAGQETEAAALQLGFLAGAVRRGAERTNGVAVELVRRMESRVQYDDPALLEAAERAAAAGAGHG